MVKSILGKKVGMTQIFDEVGRVVPVTVIEAGPCVFTAGDLVDVTGTSKGKGFAGVVKRYHWHGADMTHGSMVHRKPQSAGATDAARIFKNTGRPGHMGHERVTVKRLRVVRVDVERNMILIRGAVPGPNGGLITIREAKP